MNLDNLKNTWKEYDQKLAAQNMLNNRLLKIMMKEKSHSVLDQMRREYIVTFFALLAFTAFCFFSVIYNAFDYTHLLQYLPLILYILASLVILGLLMTGFRISGMEADRENLLESVQRILQLHKTFVSRTRKAKLIFILSGVLFPLSFYMGKYADKGAMEATGFFVFNLVVVVVIAFLFRKTGLLRDRYAEQLLSVVNELKEFEEPGAGSGFAK